MLRGSSQRDTKRAAPRVARLGAILALGAARPGAILAPSVAEAAAILAPGAVAAALAWPEPEATAARVVVFLCECLATPGAVAFESCAVLDARLFDA